MYPKNQSFFVLGLSKSGCAATEYLLSKGAETYVYDDVDGAKMEETFQRLVSLGAKRVPKDALSRVADVCDVLVLSPGIPIDHPLAVAFKRKGKAVVGETELAARNMRCPVVAVTGTNGKTTTVSLITQMLQAQGYNAHACGNIGEPLVRFCGLKEEAIAVAEISSFQLETLNSLCPHVSVVLNITEDHLNRHYNMENYTFLKAKLLKNSSGAEFAVLNYDDGSVRAFAEKTKARIVWFSLRERIRGAYYDNGNLYFDDEKIISVNELFAAGLHNVQNALATIAVGKILRVDTEQIAKTLREFRGIKHRLEKIGVVDGVTYVDDSKGTNVDATLRAIETMKENTVLLLGGKNKGYDYDRLFEKMQTAPIAHAVLYGENRYELLKSARTRGYDNVTVCKSFALAFSVAAMVATKGQTVLLSPASASFDEFVSYEERGDTFVRLVRALEESRQAKEEKIITKEGKTYDDVAAVTTHVNRNGEDDGDEQDNADDAKHDGFASLARLEPEE